MREKSEKNERDWVATRLDNPENWIPRALVWGEALAAEVFDLSEKLLVVSAFGVAARITNSPDARLAADVLGFLLALYTMARLDRACVSVFRASIFAKPTGLLLYVVVSLTVLWLLAVKVLPKLTETIEALVLAAIK